MTLAQFLGWEKERQELRHEFDGFFAPVAVIGGTRAHETVQANLPAALRCLLPQRGGA